MPTFITLTPPNFTDADLVDVLPGAPLLDDIARYRTARTQFLTDQDNSQRWVEQTCPRRISDITDLSIANLLEDDQGNKLDHHAELDKVLANIAEIEADAEERCTGPSAQKHERRHEALTEVYDNLRDRVATYVSNLPTQRAISVLMAGDEYSDGTVEGAVATAPSNVVESNAPAPLNTTGDDDGESSEELEAQEEAAEDQDVSEDPTPEDRATVG